MSWVNKAVKTDRFLMVVSEASALVEAVSSPGGW